jgi:hypothetical protein
LNPLDILIRLAATWYLAYALTNTDGPYELFKRARVRFSLGGLTTCIICILPYVALICLLVPDGILLQTFALAGVGAAFWRYTGGGYSVSG